MTNDKFKEYVITKGDEFFVVISTKGQNGYILVVVKSKTKDAKKDTDFAQSVRVILCVELPTEESMIEEFEKISKILEENNSDEIEIKLMELTTS